MDQFLRDLFPDRPEPARLRHPGLWLGQGSKWLELENPVRPGALRNLFEGRTPAGVRLLKPVQDTPDRIVAWRFGFTPPKDQLAQWPANSLHPHQIHVAHVQAVARTLESFDEDIAYLKLPSYFTGEEDPRGCIFATFRGQPGRPNNAHLTTTTFFINMAVFEDSAVVTYTSTAVVESSRRLPLLYRAYMADSLSAQAYLYGRLQTSAPPPVTRLPETSQPRAQPPLIQDQPQRVEEAPRQNHAHRYGHSH